MEDVQHYEVKEYDGRGIEGWHFSNSRITSDLSKRFFTGFDRFQWIFRKVFDFGMSQTNNTIIAFTTLYFIFDFIAILALNTLWNEPTRIGSKDILQSVSTYIFLMTVYFAAILIAKVTIERTWLGYPSPIHCDLCIGSGWVTKSGSRARNEQFYVCPSCNGLGAKICIMKKEKSDLFPNMKWVGILIKISEDEIKNKE